jgi:allantoicase
VTGTSPLVNLAARRLGASVLAASDEFFGEKENLLRPEPPSHRPGTFGLKGQLVDGWESRRRRGPGEDHALIRLGAAGVIGRVVVDTTHFTGNFPAACSVEACAAEGYPGPAELLAASWVTIVPRGPLAGDCPNIFAVTDPHRFTHLRLTIYPDGGVARLRVEGQVVPDPRQLAGLPLDLVALANGGTVVAASDRFYSPPENMISPGRAAVMGDGWETRRRRDAGHDWVLLQLTAAGYVRQAVVDTSCFLGNAPAAAVLRGCDATVAGLAAAEWSDLLPTAALQPDTEHVFRVAGAGPMTHVRLEIHPDGGLARLRLFGELTAEGRAGLGLRWFDRLPADHALAVLAAECDLAGQEAADLVARRPLAGPAQLAQLLARPGSASARLRALILG